jgi:hypothetical protein
MSQGMSNHLSKGIGKQGMSHRDSSISKQSVIDDIIGFRVSESYEQVMESNLCESIGLSPIRSRAHQWCLCKYP